MSNRIKRQIQKDIIEPERLNQFKPMLGQVVWVDIYSNRCHIRIPNMFVSKKSSYEKEDSHILLRHVPISFHSGVHNAGPFEGDQVWVGFQNNDIKLPFIMGHADTTYMHTTRRDRMEHGTKGGFLANTGFTNKDNFKSKHAPNWMNRGQYSEDWTRELKHYSEDLMKNFKNTRSVTKVSDIKGKIDELDRGTLSSVESVLQDATDSGYKHQAEVGILHPFHTSGMKIKDNAQVDIFTYPHQGIRIDPDTRSINTKSEWMKMHHSEWRAWVKGQVQWRVEGKYLCEVKGNHETIADGMFDIHSRYGDVHIEAEKESIYETAQKEIVIRAKSKDITIIAESANVNVKAAQNIDMKAGSNVSIQAGSHIGLKAPRIDFN